MFHPRCGHCVSLSNGNKTACRTNPHHEFDRGLVFSFEPIKDNEVFEIKIDKKLNTWSGSVEIGVTVCNPDVIDIPFTATDLRGGTWVLLGHGVLRDGRSVMEAYGCDLDQLVEGDRVGVMRSGHGELEFYVNGESQGVAAINLPPLLYAVVDMYGKCAQISLTSPLRSPDSNTLEVDSPSAISGSCSGSESNVLPPAAPSLQEQGAPRDASSVPAAASDLPCNGAASAPRLCSGSQTSHELSQGLEFSSARTAMEERNQLLQLEQISADNRNCTTEASQDAAEIRQQEDVSGSLGSALVDVPVSEEADMLMPLAARSLRNGEDSDDSPEEEEETDAGDKGNEKHRGRGGSSGPARAVPVRDSNIILSNTEQLCRLLNVTMESIMSGGCGSGSSPAQGTSSATGASALSPSTCPGSYTPKEPANIAQCDEDICNDSEDGDDDATQCVARFRNNYGFNSAFVNNTINTIRQSEDHSQRQVNGTVTSGDNTGSSNFRAEDGECMSQHSRSQCTSDEQCYAEHHDSHAAHERPSLRRSADYGSSVCQGSVSPNVPLTSSNMPPASSAASDSCSQVALLLAESNFSQVPCSNSSSSSRRGQVVEAMLAQRGQGGGGGATRRSSSGGRRSSASNNSSPYRCGRRPRVSSAAPEGASHRSSSLSRHRNESVVNTAGSNSVLSSDGPPSCLGRNLPSDVCSTPVLLSARVRDSSPSSPTRMSSRGGIMESLFPLPRSDASAVSSREGNPGAAGVVCAVNHTTGGSRSTGMSPGQSAAGGDSRSIPPSSEADSPSGGGAEGAGDGDGSSSPPPQSSHPASSGRSVGVDRLQFHEKCGMLVRLSNYGRTAERVHPLDEFNNGVVMSNRALRENELFEIRIDRLVDKWSGSIEVGITTHNPATLEFPATMTNLRSGTTMMSGTGILKNGKGMLRQYGDFNLDELQEGDRIGMMIRSGRTLHYFINGLEQGVASTEVPAPVWSVVDLYGMTVKVTLVDRDPREQQNLLTRQIAHAEERRSGMAVSSASVSAPMSCETDNCINTDPLMFSPECGSSAQVINGGLTAHRPNALEDFNHGVVLTSRPLRPGEMLEVRLDQCVYMWAGSLEIGVTTHSPHSFEYPSTMTKVTTGTWMMTGDGGVKHNGTTIINEYGLNLDRLQVGDRAGVVRHADGFLHFFVNGADQGIAATGVPEGVYGVVDLYGQAAQATIIRRGAGGQQPGSGEAHAHQVGPSPARGAAANMAGGSGVPASGRSSHQPQARVLPLQQQVQPQVQQQVQQQIQQQAAPQVPAGSTVYSDLRFHELHGRNASVIRNGLGAERPHADAEFNDAIVISNRQLHEGEMFEVMIEKVVDRWSGSLEAGVTAIHPEDIEFPSTMTDIDYDTWMLSGSSVMMNGVTIKNNYACDLDSLGIGSRIGMMRHADATLHYYVNGVDQGAACTNLPAGIWAVVDLYGQCAQVSIVHNPVNCEQLSAASATRLADSKRQQQQQQQQQQQPQQKADSAVKEQVCHQFSYCHGTGVTVSEGRGALHRTSRQEGAAAVRAQASCLAFTSSPLSFDELFEVRITRIDPELRGSIRVGLTTLPMLPNLSIHSVPPSLSSVHPVPPSDTWWVGESNAYHNFCGWKPPLLLPGIAGQNALDDATGTRPALGRSSHESGTRSVSFADKCGGNSSRMNTAWTVSLAKHDFCPHLSKLVVGDRIGVKRTSDGCMRLYINGFDFGVAATGIQESNVVLGVVELHGNCIAVETTSYVREEASPVGDKPGSLPSGAVAAGVVSQDSLELSAVGVTPATEGSGNTQPRPSTNADASRLAEQPTGSGNSFSQGCPSGGALQHEVTGGIRYNTRTSFTFSGRHGKNIVLSADRTIAVRKKGYNHGLTVTARPLPRNTMFTIVLSGVDPSFCGGAMLGLLFPGSVVSADDSSLSNTVLPDDLPVAASSLLPNDVSRSSLGVPDDSSRCGPLLEDVPGSALDLLTGSCECVLLCGSNVYRGQSKLCSDYGPDLNSVTPGTTLGLCIDAQARLHLFVNGTDCGVAAHNLPPNPYVLLDLYGSANEAHIVNCEDASHSGVAEQALKKKTQHNNNQQQQQQSRRQLQQQLHQHSSADGESFVLSNHDEMNLAISRSMNSSAEHVLNSAPATSDRHDPLSDAAPCNKNASLNCCNHSTSCLDHDTTGCCKALKSCSLDNSTNCNSVFHAATLADVNNGSIAAPNGINNFAASDSGNGNNVGTNSGAGTAVTLTNATVSSARTQQNKVKASARGVDASVKKCPYQRLCCRFLASLSLPGAYFSSDVLCYCDACHRARGEEAVYTKGNGVEYHRPLGWCRYGLVSGSGDSVCDSWHMAYCAARPGHVRRMLDKGELLFPGELELGFPRRGGRSKEEEGDGSMISVSPSVAVAAAAALPTTGLLERGCGRSYSGRVLLQVAVKPGAYKKLDCDNDTAVGSGVTAPVAPPTAARGATRSDDKPHTRVRWVTKERGATQLLALLVAVEQVEKT